MQSIWRRLHALRVLGEEKPRFGKGWEEPDSVSSNRTCNGSISGIPGINGWRNDLKLLRTKGRMECLPHISGTTPQLDTPQLDVWLLGFVPLTPATIVFLVAESLAIVVLITWVEIRHYKEL